MSKPKSILPTKLFGNRVIIAVKPPEVSKGTIIHAIPGAFGNPNFREAVVVQTGQKVVEKVFPGDRVCWNGQGGVPFKGMLVVSVLDLEFKIV